MTRGIKRNIIKRLMKACERLPQADDYHLSEVFNHRSFTEGTVPEREAIMLKSSEWAYQDESQRHSFESYFTFVLQPVVRFLIVDGDSHRYSHPIFS